MSASRERDFFTSIQKKIITAFSKLEPKAHFVLDPWKKDSLGEGVSAVLGNGAVIEKGGVNYSQVSGKALPNSATERHPHLAQQAFSACGVSVVIHPKNPFVPTSHFNIRLIRVKTASEKSQAWMGGGFDLTPYYGFEEDCILWHRFAKEACDAHDPQFYPRFKKACDDYFYLTHRKEARGIGGLFFDDLPFENLDQAFSFLESITQAYIQAYTQIVEKRKNTPYGEKERAFQAYRRGRYVEFNLIYDRGTLFGLQSGGRVESILMSLPPEVHWHYDWHPQPGTPEAALYTHFLPPQNWLEKEPIPHIASQSHTKPLLELDIPTEEKILAKQEKAQTESLSQIREGEETEEKASLKTKKTEAPSCEAAPWLEHYPAGVPAQIEKTDLSLQNLIQEAAHTFPHHPAFSCMGKTLSFQEIFEHAQHFSNYCRAVLALKKGDCLAIMLPNILQYPIALLGGLLAGLVIVNLNPLDKAESLAHELSDSGAKAVIVLENFVSELEKVLPQTALKKVIITSMGDLQPLWKRFGIHVYFHYLKKSIPSCNLSQAVSFSEVLKKGAHHDFILCPVEPHDLAFIQYTGGTTGIAKGVMLSHSNMMSNILQVQAWVKNVLSEGQEIIVTALPLYHIFSLLVNCFLFIKMGGHNLLIPDPRNIPALVKDLKQSHFTCLSGVNTLFNALLHSPAFCAMNHAGMKLSIGGGMAIQQAVAEAWQAKTGKVLIQGYGLTEASPVVAINPLESTSFTGSIGLPISSTEVSIQDKNGNILPAGVTGELCIKGPQVMQGYYHNPSETQKALKQGWLHTADAAYMNEKGFLFIVDRLKDMVIVSGFNVYPAEVENMIKKMPGVNEVAVIGIPDALHGEVVKAFIVKEKKSRITAQKVIDFCHERLAAYKTPHQVEFIEALPKSAVGKILKKDLHSENL